VKSREWKTSEASLYMGRAEDTVRRCLKKNGLCCVNLLSSRRFSGGEASRLSKRRDVPTHPWQPHLNCGSR
jgi:hypothetical protein